MELDEGNNDFLSQEEVNALLKAVTGEDKCSEVRSKDDFATYLTTLVNKFNSKANSHEQLAKTYAEQAELVCDIIKRYEETH